MKRESKFDPALEQKHIQEILGDLDDDDRDIQMEDPSYGTGMFKPIALHQSEFNVSLLFAFNKSISFLQSKQKTKQTPRPNHPPRIRQISTSSLQGNNNNYFSFK